MKFGLGVITTGDRKLRPEYTQYLESDTTINIHVDKTRKGPARSRNIVLKSLYDDGCDVMVLFDDDAWPRRPGWLPRCTEAAQADNLDLVGSPDAINGKVLGIHGSSVLFEGYTTPYYWLTRRCIETVGYFDERYGQYGYEDTDYGWRAQNHGLTGPYGFAVPVPFLQMFHLEDLFGAGGKSTVDDATKLVGIEAGRKILDAKLASNDWSYIGYNEHT